jgi:hypothetical protein
MRMNIGAPRRVIEAALANIKKAERRVSKNIFSLSGTPLRKP